MATQFTSTQAGSTTDWLAAGASITTTLNANGTTSGQLVFPGEPTEDLTGTWTLRGSAVRMNHPNADTFLRDMDFQVQGNTLVGDETFSDPDGPVRVRVTLTRQ